MKVTIQQEIAQMYLIPFNIKPKKVIQTITSPDKSKQINFTGYIVNLFLKKFKNHYLFVDARSSPDSPDLGVAAVFMIAEQKISDISVANLVGVLEQFANDVGYSIHIGDQKSKFIHDAVIIGDEKAPPIQENAVRLASGIWISDNGKQIGASIGDSLIKQSNLSGKIQTEIALMYQISVEKYNDYLRSHSIG